MSLATFRQDTQTYYEYVSSKNLSMCMELLLPISQYYHGQLS